MLSYCNAHNLIRYKRYRIDKLLLYFVTFHYENLCDSATSFFSTFNHNNMGL